MTISVVVTETNINASVTQLSNSVALTETNINASVTQTPISVGVTTSPISASVLAASPISVLVTQTNISASISGGGGSGGVTDHALLTNLDYASAGHTGFQATLTADVDYLTPATAALTYQPIGSYLTDAPSDGSTYGRKNGAWSAISAGITDHSLLSNLDFASAGHTGFQASLGFTPPPNTRSISINAPLSGGGDLSADRTISISQAGAASDGYLSSVDWNTFNNKQGALTFPLAANLGGTGVANLVGSTLTLGGATTISVFGASLTDDIDAATARTTLGLVAGGTGDIWVEKAGDTMTGQLFVDGSADQTQLRVQAHSTQTSNLATFETSTGYIPVTIYGDGRILQQPIASATSQTAFQVDFYNTAGIDGLLYAMRFNMYERNNGLTSGFGLGYGFQGGLALEALTANSFVRTAYGAAMGVSISANAPYTASTVNGMRAMQIFAPGVSGAGTILPGRFYGLFIENQGNAKVVNSNGIWIADQSGSTGSNFAIQTNAGLIVFNEGGDAATDVRIEGDTDATLFFTDASVDMVGIGTNAPAALLHLAETTTTNNAILAVQRIEARVSTASTGGAAGFGAGQSFYAETATDLTYQQQAQIASSWIDATNATRKAKLSLSAYDTAARLGMEIEASGAAAKLGFFGAATVLQQTGDIVAGLNNLGLFSAASLKASGIHASTAITYISGTGTAGADNTAQTVKSLTLPGNSLTQVGDRLRIRAYWTGDTGSPVTGSCMIGPAGSEVLVSHTTDGGAATLQLNEVWLHYVDNTHANIIENEAGTLGALSAPNVAGFDWDSNQAIIFTQDAISNNHCILYALIVDIFPKGI